MNKSLRGIVHGKTIELDQDPGVGEGRAVEVHMKLVENRWNWGDGILRTAGALKDDSEWDAIMEEVYQSRKTDSRHPVDFPEAE